MTTQFGSQVTPLEERGTSGDVTCEPAIQKIVGRSLIDFNCNRQPEKTRGSDFG
ncbi:MAG: hypothetical protein IPM55_07865 [Acidobacteria bacterium]|nr:hypothetical protein [Acidobacteriota bacterium]